MRSFGNMKTLLAITLFAGLLSCKKSETKPFDKISIEVNGDSSKKYLSVIVDGNRFDKYFTTHFDTILPITTGNYSVYSYYKQRISFVDTITKIHIKLF